MVGEAHKMTESVWIVAGGAEDAALLASHLAPLGAGSTRVADAAEARLAIDDGRARLVVVDAAAGAAGELVARAAEARRRAVAIAPRGRGREIERSLAGAAVVERPIDGPALATLARALLEACGLEDELTRERAAAERVRARQHEFDEAVIHDLKGPIAAARMSVAWVRERIAQSSDGDLLEALTDAEDAARRMQRLVEDLLTIARFEARKLPRRRQTVALASLVDAALGVHALEAKSRDVAIRSRVEPASVEADPVLLQRAIEAVVEVVLRRVTRGGYLELEGRRGKTGPSITFASDARPFLPGDAPSVFDRTGASLADGTHEWNGFGLYYCRLIVEDLGGSIAMADVPGAKLAFSMSLPAPSGAR
jgi:K+-sensing histidine kinase KdpD